MSRLLLPDNFLPSLVTLDAVEDLDAWLSAEPCRTIGGWFEQHPHTNPAWVTLRDIVRTVADSSPSPTEPAMAAIRAVVQGRIVAGLDDNSWRLAARPKPDEVATGQWWWNVNLGCGVHVDSFDATRTFAYGRKTCEGCYLVGGMASRRTETADLLAYFGWLYIGTGDRCPALPPRSSVAPDRGEIVPVTSAPFSAGDEAEQKMGSLA